MVSTHATYKKYADDWGMVQMAWFLLGDCLYLWGMVQMAHSILVISCAFGAKAVDGGKSSKVTSGYVQIAIEHGH